MFGRNNSLFMPPITQPDSSMERRVCVRGNDSVQAEVWHHVTGGYVVVIWDKDANRYLPTLNGKEIAKGYYLEYSDAFDYANRCI